MGEEGLVGGVGGSWGRDHCEGLIESEKHEGRQGKAEEQEGTGDLGGKGEFGPLWREVSKEPETSPGVVAWETQVPVPAVPARQMKWGRCTSCTTPCCTSMWKRGPAGAHISWPALLRCLSQVSYL